jgi:hypothetical protein
MNPFEKLLFFTKFSVSVSNLILFSALHFLAEEQTI